MKNQIIKTFFTTLFIFTAFVFSYNNSLAIEVCDEMGFCYDDGTTVPTNTYTNPNIDYAWNNCSYYGDCYTPTTTTYTPYTSFSYTPATTVPTNTYTNPNIDYVWNDCGYYGDCYTPTTTTYAPTYTAPTYTSPTYTTPSYTAPTYTSPTYTAPTYTTPSYTSPTYYTAPTYTPPSYTTPTYTTPTYTTPTYRPPVYNPTPTYTTPTYNPAPTYSMPPATVGTTRPPVYTPAPVYNPTPATPASTYAPITTTNTSSWWNYAPVTTTNTNTNTSSYWNYAPVTTTNTNTNTNINNTCAGQNNCNINTNTTFTTVNTNNSVNGSFNTTYAPVPTYTAPTPVCTNGATNYPGCNVCPATLVFQNGSCVNRTTTCPTGQYWNGSYCVTQTRTCPNGQVVNTWEVCPTQTQTCWNGSVIPVTSVCPSQYKTCPNGTTVLITQQCYRTCQNGTTVPDTQTCYRVCPNGSTVPEAQYCPVVNNYPTVDININPSIVNRGEGAVLTWTSQYATYCTASNGWSGNVNLSGSMNRNNLLDATTYTITCFNAQGQSATDSTTVTVRQNLPTSHRVVTTAPTQITKTSARCNGVGIISNGVYSSGWFEYGETRDLGRVTNSASIGNLPSSPFGNQLTGLKSNTTYYCRAVMSNADGTYRGDILSFRTTGDIVNYIPVKPATTKTKTPAKPIICMDDTGAKESLADGEKLMSITLDKKSGTVAIGNEVEYRANYINTSKIKLTNATIKIVLPSEMTFVSSNRGIYDQSNNSVVANLDTVGAGESGDMIVRVKVRDNAAAGKSAVVSSYISYDALDSRGNDIKDENTAYIISTIAGSETQNQNNNVDNNLYNKDTPTKTSDRSVLPNTVLEWLAIIALILVLIVLGRTIYTGIKGEAHNHH